MNHQRSEIIVSNMSLCQPAAALAWENRYGCWRLVDYETEDGLKGVTVYADPEFNAPPLELPLNVSGPHKIYLGVNYPKSRYTIEPDRLPWSDYGNVEVKLTRDQGFTRVGAEKTPIGGSKVTKIGSGKSIARSIQEAYWKTADLTGQALHFKPVGEPYTWPDWWGIANLSYVRLVPLDAQDEAIWRQLQPRDDTRRVGYIFCAGALSGHIDGGSDFHPASLDWFKDEIAPCLDSDVGLFIMEAIRGNLCTFRTKVGDVGGPDNRWHDEWVDPLAAFTQLAHANGIRISVALRFIGAQYPLGRSPLQRARFFWQHPEWVRRDREGRPTTSLSLAYPGVQEHWLALLREALNYGIDGVTIYLHRFMPFVLYDEPVMAAFKAKYGEDPRQLPEDDPRWIQHCADYMTDFLRQVRRLVDEVPGRHLGVSFYGVPSKNDRNQATWEPLKYQCDVATWIHEGIADYLFPVQGPKPELVQHLSALSQGRVHIWPDLYPRHQLGEDFARAASAYYEAGADGVVLWDAERRSPRLSEWAVQRLLGHREMLAHLVQEAPSYYRRRPIKYLQGFNTRYSFNNFGL